MLPVDPLLYVALAAGFLAGRILPHRPQWTGPATLATVFLLVALLGASLGTVSPGTLLSTIPLAAAFGGTILGGTVLVTYLLRAPGSRRRRSDGRKITGWWLSPALLATLVVGYGVGRGAGWSFDPGIEVTLYAMLALVAFDLRWSRAGLRRIWVPLGAAFTGAVAAGAVFGALGILPSQIALATGLGFGWYTLTGALVAANAGATFGFVAFLTNFLRENLTMVTSPWAGPVLGGEGMSAIGGATSMDTTLYFITRYSDRDSGGLALAVGLVLTLSASLLVPFVLGVG